MEYLLQARTCINFVASLYSTFISLIKERRHGTFSQGKVTRESTVTKSVLWHRTCTGEVGERGQKGGETEGRMSWSRLWKSHRRPDKERKGMETSSLPLLAPSSLPPSLEPASWFSGFPARARTSATNQPVNSNLFIFVMYPMVPASFVSRSLG